jgi:hypothetical protein
MPLGGWRSTEVIFFVLELALCFGCLLVRWTTELNALVENSWTQSIGVSRPQGQSEWMMQV